MTTSNQLKKATQEIEATMSIVHQGVGENRRDSNRYRGGAGWRVSPGSVVAAVLLAGALSACAPEQQPNLGSTGSAQVNLNITMPQNVAAVATPQNSVWAKVEQWVFGTEAWAATVNEIAALVVRVTGPGILSPVENRVPVTGAVGGQIIPVTLEVPVGMDRVFTVSARNIANQTIFQGQSAPLTLTAGEAATANVRLTDTTIRIATTVLPDGTEGRSYAATLLADQASGAVTWTIRDGVLPPGVSLNGSTGALTGTPTTVGVFPITVRVTDAAVLFDEESLSIRINPAPIPPKIATTTLPDGTVGNSYNATVVATGGTGASAWSVVSGVLPPGLTLNGATGAIAGTPTKEGTVSFTLRATDTIPLTGEKTLSIKINPAPIPPTITTTNLPDGTEKAKYSTQVKATDGTGALTWSVSAGALPPGLALNSSTGIIAGTPTTNGTFNFTIRATDTVPLSNQKALTITIKNAPLPPEITTTALPGGRVGDSYRATLAATSKNGAVTWRVTSGKLPSGFTLNTTTGLITGTPAAVGTFEFTIRATDPLDLFDEQALFIQIGEKLTPPIITTTSLPDGVVEFDDGELIQHPYSATLTATGGTGAITWHLVLGALPPGLTLDSSTGSITGAPTDEGTSSFTIRATDAAGFSDSGEFSIRVIEQLSITTSSLPVGIASETYNPIFDSEARLIGKDFQLQASGGAGSYTWEIVSGALPSGLTLSAGGLISGTPVGGDCSPGGIFTEGTFTDNFTVTFQVKDDGGAIARKEFIITITTVCLG